MNTKLLALYGLKWHPFTTEVPTEAIHVPARLEHFCWRIEQGLIGEGGFAMIHGDPGTGKSVALRLLAERLARLPDLTVGAIAHPQSSSPFGRLRPNSEAAAATSTEHRLHGPASAGSRTAAACIPPACIPSTRADDQEI